MCINYSRHTHPLDRYPNGQKEGDLEKRIYRWIENPNRFKFIKNGTYNDFYHREFQENNTRSLLVDDPDSILNLTRGNGTGDLVGLRQEALNRLFGDPIITSRTVGQVHR